jgi:hypothetical protein
MDKDLPKALRMAFNDAADTVADDARARVPSDTGKARKSVKTASTQSYARIRGGGNRAPYYPWLDFGGQIGARSGRKQGRRGKRPWLPKGRYIYNAYFKHRDSGDFQESLSESIIKVAKSAGLEVTHG